MKIGVVIPTLKDRPKFLEFCFKRLSEQTRKPDLIALVDFQNKSGLVDISQRYKIGIKYLIDNGCDLILFIEDDDYYPLTYIEETYNLWLSSGKPLVMGCKQTVYYHLPTRQYLTTSPKHCSAYCTSISKDAVYNVCGDNEAYYDYNIWKNNKGIQVIYKNKPIGIKHGIGKCGGTGHNPNKGWYKLKDNGFDYLKENTDEDAFRFYARMFHSKHLPVDWGCWSLGDYRVINNLHQKLRPRWINEVLTKTQGKPNRGK